MAALQNASALWFHTRLATLLLPDQGCFLGFPVHSFIHASFIHSFNICPLLGSPLYIFNARHDIHTAHAVTRAKVYDFYTAHMQVCECEH